MFLIPPIIAIILWKMRAAQTVTSIRLFPGKKPSIFQRNHLPFWLVTLAATLAAAAFHQPAITCTASRPETVAPNLAILIDLSGSMNAVDWPEGTEIPQHPTPEQLPPTRLETAKQHIKELLAQTHNARAALIAFAQNTVLVAPLAQDTSFLEQRLEILQPEQFQDGTAIGKAILAAIKALEKAPPGPKTIILLSDGVDHDHLHYAPEQAAQNARDQRIPIHAVAIGGRHALHPVATEHGLRWEQVGEPLDAQQLATIAQTTQGQVFQAPDAEKLAQAINQIKQHLNTQSTEFKITRKLPLAPALLAAAAASATLAMALNKKHTHEP